MDLNIVDRWVLLDSIPHGFEKNQKVRDQVLQDYYFELGSIITQAQKAEADGHKVSIYFGKFSGQTAFFEIRAKDLPIDEHKYNWHGQNTSQWLYAGCIQVSKDGSVSTHH